MNKLYYCSLNTVILSLYKKDEKHRVLGVTLMNIQDMINTKEIELNLLKLANYYCSNCGFVKIDKVFICSDNNVYCKYCGDEIEQ